VRDKNYVIYSVCVGGETEGRHDTIGNGIGKIIVPDLETQWVGENFPLIVNRVFMLHQFSYHL
jgi:hypothetical protein